ncbi:uroporphyrinogen-III C-methyltransferase [Halomonas sp. HP20-15]|uniref:uroporphyrinogen-III C-methyltransferase n=1 Tax=Halomonas sp. HP20-15 TaxID=3085901 RepID=UPI002980DF26|nr:uroporphyrinogen-III C-methyltransferase [Halomonas sp. HP20-15]MDW5376128.1 uroporphyrinogen-III C-methyltransferase [Halomonas sp. HP20-15]
MSKQEHDQDGQRASSGAGKDKGKADEASKRPADATPEQNASAPQNGERPAASKADEGKPATSEQGASATKTPPGSSASPDSANVSSTRSATATTKNADAGKSDSGKSDSGKKRGGNRPASDDAKSSAAASSTTPPSDKPAGSRDSAKPAAASAAAKPTGGSGSGGKPPGDQSGNGGKAGGIALALVIVLALVVLLGGWWGWQKFQAQQQRLAQAEGNAQAISQLQSQLGDGDQQRQQAMQALRNDFQQYREEMNATLDKVLKQLASKQQTDTSEWRLAEVEYLLRLANQRLQLERDVRGAMSLLKTADERLAQIDNPALTPVRRAIQSELAALDSVVEVDRTGIYLELMAQQEQLAQLPLEQDIQQQAAEAGDTSPVKGGWEQQLSRFGQELKDLVVVRKHDQALEALMTPEQESYLRQNVRLQLEQAQLALLQSDAKLYEASLDKARKLIERYYDTDNQGVANSLERLATLAGKNVHPELPDISASLQQLRDFMERRHDAGSDAA